MTEVNRVEIRFKNLRFAVAALHVTCGTLFAQLAADRGVTAVDQVRVHVAHQLLRDGARTAGVAHDRVLHRRRHTHQIDAVVLVEALVFDRDEGLTEVAWQ